MAGGSGCLGQQVDGEGGDAAEPGRDVDADVVEGHRPELQDGLDERQHCCDRRGELRGRGGGAETQMTAERYARIRADGPVAVCGRWTRKCEVLGWGKPCVRIRAYVVTK